MKQEVKTWVAIGDSFTFLDGNPATALGGFQKGYLGHTLEKLKFPVRLVHLGIDGGVTGNFFDLSLPEGDFYSILLGTNDWHAALYPSGAREDFDAVNLSTYVGHIALLIQHIRQVNPNAWIFVLNPVERAPFVYRLDHTNNAPDSLHPRKYGLLEDFANAIVESVHGDKIQVVDIHRRSGILPTNCVHFMQINGERLPFPLYSLHSYDPKKDTDPYPSEATYYTFDGLHPSDLGAEAIALPLSQALNHVFSLNSEDSGHHFENGHYEGERALFQTKDATLENVLFDNGESPLKESQDLTLDHCTFGWKYPLWYGKRFYVTNSHWLEMARAGVWYTDDASFMHCQIDAPKNFRKCHRLRLENCDLPNAEETLWWNEDVYGENLKAKGNYFGMGSKRVIMRQLVLDGNYAFDGASELYFKDCVLHTKDAFWNCHHVVLDHCVVEGEYFGWNSEDVTLIDCEIHSHQGFCYMKGIKLIRTKVIDTDLSFEYCSDIDADIITPVLSIKNPISGTIRLPSVGTLIRDDPAIDPSKTNFIFTEHD